VAETVRVPLNRGLLTAYLVGLGLMLGALLVLLYRVGQWNQEALLFGGLFVAVILLTGPELATVVKSGYCLRADERGIRVGAWRREIFIPWAAVARTQCVNPAWNRKGVHSLVIHLKADSHPAPARADGSTLGRIPPYIRVKGTYIGADCHAVKQELDALLALHGHEVSEIPSL